MLQKFENHLSQMDMGEKTKRIRMIQISSTAFHISIETSAGLRWRWVFKGFFKKRILIVATEPCWKTSKHCAMHFRKRSKSDSKKDCPRLLWRVQWVHLLKWLVPYGFVVLRCLNVLEIQIQRYYWKPHEVSNDYCVDSFWYLKFKFERKIEINGNSEQLSSKNAFETLWVM